MTRLILSAIAALAAGFVASVAQAQVYKCIDAGGSTIYSQYPCPPNAKSTTFGRPARSEPDSAGSAGDAGKSNTPKLTPEQEFRKRQQDRLNAEKDADQKLAAARQKEESCRSAREQLAQFEIGGRVARVDDKGERYYPDEAQIEQIKADARAAVARECN